MGDTCFVITPIGAPDSPQRARADRLCDLIIAPVLRDSEFDIEMVRGDRIQEPGPITVQLVEQLLDARLVVVDLVEPNPNVYYELGMAEAFHRPVVRFGGDAPLPFDVRDMRTLSLPQRDNGFIDVVDAMKCRDELAKLLPIMLSDGYKPDSIVSRARRQAQLDSFAQKAREGGSASEQMLAELLERMDALSRESSQTRTILETRDAGRVRRAGKQFNLNVFTTEGESKLRQFAGGDTTRLIHELLDLNVSASIRPLGYGWELVVIDDKIPDLATKKRIENRILSLATYFKNPPITIRWESSSENE